MNKLRIISIFILTTIGYINYSNAQPNSWNQKASMIGFTRDMATDFVIGHYGFICNGVDGSSYYNDCYKWDQTINTWSAIANYPGLGQYACIGFSINGKGYVGLGFDGASCQSDIWAYDTTSNTWIQQASFPANGRYSSFVFVIGQNAYVGCGSPGGPPYYSDFWVYNGNNNTWRQLNNFPGGDREGLVAITIGKYGYVGAGFDGANNYSDFWQYDTSTDTWNSLANIPVSGGGLGGSTKGFVIGGTGYVGTGSNNSLTLLRNFWAYDTSTNSWSAIASLGGVSRRYAIAFSIGNKGYCGTGMDSLGAYLNDFWEYSDTTSTSGIVSIYQNKFEVNLYPNPGNGNISVCYKGLPSNKSELEISDMIGRVINTFTVTGKEGILKMNESFLCNGIYFCQITSSDKLIYTGKLIIAK